MTRRSVVVILLALATGAAIQGWILWLERGTQVAERSRPVPSDAVSRFRERLLAEAQIEVEPLESMAAGRAARFAIEERLDAVATRLDSEALDWRPVFGELARRHPATEPEVLELYRVELAAAERFVLEHDMVPLPAEHLTVEAVDNPMLRRTFPLALYLEPARLGVVLRPPRAPGPVPGYLANHCAICVPPLAVHEGYPGHHVAYSLARESRAGEERGVGSAGRANMTFHEGWGQYAELLMLEAGYWAAAPERELGALRLILLRALRAEVDGALVAGRLDAAGAEALYVETLRMTRGAARAEVAGHRQDPGRKSSYLVGALQILALRAALERAPGDVSRRQLHRVLLEHPAPIPAIARERFGVELPPRLPPVDLLPLSAETGEVPR